MKPRTQREREIVRLSATIGPINKTQLDWAKQHCFEHIAHKCKDIAWCSECAKSFSVHEGDLATILVDEEVYCPHCGEKLLMKVSRKKKNEESDYLTICTIYGGYQVLRHVYLCKCAYSNTEYSHFYHKEVVQEWISKDGKRTIMAAPMNTSANGWLYGKEMSIKNEYGNGYYRTDMYAIFGTLYPRMEVLPELKQRGIKNSFFGGTPSKVIRWLLEGCNDYEYLIKTKQIDILHYLWKTYKHHTPCKHALNICIRNNYKIKDVSMWFDYLDLLNYFNLDTHNAYYVCPKNLKLEHDKLMHRKQKQEAERRRIADEQAKIRNALKRRTNIRSFYEQKMKFFGLVIASDDIVIQPLQSVTEFYKEGKAMKHCVFTNGYWHKDDCLILTAQIEGKHIETIELNLETFEVVQSRSVCNQNSEYHEKILKVVRKNINQVKQLAA